MKLNKPPKNTSILWLIIRQHFISTIGTIVTLVALIIIFSLLVTELTPWQQDIESFIGISFYSINYFLILGIIFFLGLFIALFYTFFIGYPLVKELKNNLKKIIEGTDEISRGKLNHRITIDGPNELKHIGQEINNMTIRIEKQVNSLQKLVDENVRLVKQTKMNAALDERKNLARELHDAVSQELFAISMALSALPKLIDSDKEKAKVYFAQVEDMVVKAQQELRALIMHLRPVTLDGSSLYVGLTQLLTELKSKHSQINWEWEIDEEISLNPGVEDSLFRVIQESISNMLRHSKANNLRLKLSKKKDRVLLTIEDNGVGFDILDKKKSSYGLINMNERVENIGGRLKIITLPDKGTRIEVRVPIITST